MSRFCKFGKLHVTKGNVDKLLGMGKVLYAFSDVVYETK